MPQKKWPKPRSATEKNIAATNPRPASPYLSSGTFETTADENPGILRTHTIFNKGGYPCALSRQSALLFSLRRFLATSSRAQSIELFGGYSFVRPSVTYFQTPQGTCVITGCPTTTTTQTLNFNGWEVGGAFKVLGPLALAADFSDTSGSFQGANTRLKTYPGQPAASFSGPAFLHLCISWPVPRTESIGLRAVAISDHHRSNANGFCHRTRWRTLT